MGIQSLSKPTGSLSRFIDKMSFYPITYLLLLLLIGDVSVSCIFSYILFPENSHGLTFSSPLEEFLLVIIVAPIFETLIFQSFIIKKMIQYFPNNKSIAIMASALFFGLSHYYSIPYIIKATIAGILYGLLYFILLHKKKNPVIYIISVHAIYNLIGFIINSIDR